MCAAKCLVGGIALVLSILAGVAAEGRRPNVLLIAADDLRPLLGCYGAAGVRTPHLDRLATQGVLFERAFVQQAWCAPSRTSVLTGLRPDTTRVYDLETHFRTTAPGAVTLPQHFKAHGYTTAGFGKVFHETMDDPASWSAPAWRPAHADPLRAYAREENIRTALRRRGYAAPTERGDEDDEAYPDGQAATAAIAFLRAPRSGPFFLALGFYKPHLPFAAPARYWDDSPESSPLGDERPPLGSPAQAFLARAEQHNYLGVPPPGSTVSPALARELGRGYRATVAFVDAQVGRVLAALDELGLADNTVVVFWGDHGWKLGEFGHWSKNTVYDVDTRVPLLVRGPGAKAGRRAATLVELVDLFPTLVDLAGLPAPAGLDGQSFAPVLAGRTDAHKTAAFTQVIRNDARDYTTYARATWMGQSVRTDRYRFVRWFRRDAPEIATDLELYELAGAAHERVNVAAEPARAGMVREATALLDATLRPAFRP